MTENLIEDILSRVSRFASILGISKSELRIYATLLLEGQMTARQISDKLEISYTKVYSILTKLEERGWIRKTGKKPSYYYAIPIRDLWANIKKLLEEKINEFEKQFIEPISAMLSSSSSYTIMVIPTVDLKKTIFEILNENSKRYYVVLSYPELVTNDVIELLSTKVFNSEVRLLVTSSVSVTKIPPESIKRSDNMFGSGIITASSVLLIVKNNDRLSGILSNHKYFVDIATVYFNHLWESSSK
ncbi:MAG: BlaI/MecI/CopY family transcriptional regulator [Candidatus Aramenus sp.]|nr:BlaI/MecI/CopY family transcriptional regulator [Candidatus Aramenus sp.]